MAEEELRTRFLSTYAGNIKNGLYEAEDVERVERGDTALLKGYVTHLKGVVDDAVPYMDTALQWRKSFGVKDLSDDSFPKSLIDQNVIFFSNTDKKGDTILHVQCVKMKKDTAYTEVVKRFLVSRIERHFQLNMGKCLVVLFDMTGTGINNVDTNFIRFLISCFSTYYPATMSYLLLVDMPWILSAVWQLVKKWLSAEQQQYVKVVKKAELLKFIDEDQLLTNLGGNCSSIQDPIEAERLKKISSIPLALLKDVSRSGSLNTSPIKDLTKGASLGHKPTEGYSVGDATMAVNCKGPDKQTEDDLSNGLNAAQWPNTENSLFYLNNIKSVFVNPVDYLEFDPVYNLTSTIFITNRSTSFVAYKIKATQPLLFKVKPVIGLLEPSKTARISCTAVLGSQLEKMCEKVMVSLVLVAEEGDMLTHPKKIQERWSSLSRHPQNSADYKIDCRLDQHTLEYLESRKTIQKELIRPSQDRSAESLQLAELKRLILITMCLALIPFISFIYIYFKTKFEFFC